MPTTGRSAIAWKSLTSAQYHGALAAVASTNARYSWFDVSRASMTNALIGSERVTQYGLVACAPPSAYVPDAIGTMPSAITVAVGCITARCSAASPFNGSFASTTRSRAPRSSPTSAASTSNSANEFVARLATVTRYAPGATPTSPIGSDP